MKRIFFMFLALLLCVMVQAQDNVEITLNNGNVVKGVTKTLFMLDDGDVVVAKDSKYREKKEYKSTEIKSIKYYDSKSKEWIKFVPLMAQKSLPSVWNKNPKPYKTPIFLKPVYEGKNVSAYIHYISTITNTKTLHLEGTNYVFYFNPCCAGGQPIGCRPPTQPHPRSEAEANHAQRAENLASASCFPIILCTFAFAMRLWRNW